MKVGHWLKSCRSALLALAALGFVATAGAGDLIPRTITINGTFTDWDGTGGTYNPPGNIFTNPDQYGTDCQSAAACERDGTLSSTGRDLKRFAFTWDNTNLYFYVERWGGAVNNVTDWWFYMDSNGDGNMVTGEKVMRVNWKGSNQTTTVTLWNYTQVAVGGDPVKSTVTGVADGYTMPGTISGETAVYVTNGGSAAGTEMESYLPWTSLGVSGPVNMTFHVSSSNGTGLPGNVIDNVEGPGNNQLFPSDIKVTKTASVTATTPNFPFTYTVQVANLGFQTITGVAISDVLPANVVYSSHVAGAGSYVDTNANSIPDRWNIATLPAQTTYTLTITCYGGNVTAPTSVTNTATLVAYTGTNFYTANDTASVTITANPSPVLNVTKFASTATAAPGTVVRYNAYISNVGYTNATQVVVTDAFSRFSAFRLNTFGAGTNFQFTQGSPTSTLTMGTATYSNNNGATWTYTPVSGGGGAPAGYDANVTNFRIPMTGTMPGNGANFTITYDVIVR